MLTFDDGFRSWLTDVAPLFGRLGVRGTFYVSPGLFGKQHWRVPGDAGRLLDEDEARALAAVGMELGSHRFRIPTCDSWTAGSSPSSSGSRRPPSSS